jgi:hypothetical protein
MVSCDLKQKKNRLTNLLRELSIITRNTTGNITLNIRDGAVSTIHRSEMVIK